MTRISFSHAQKLGFVPLKSGSKHKNKLTEYNGITYHSKKEADFAKDLDLCMSIKGDKRVVKWTPQVPFEIKINGEKICTYKLDFLVEYADGTKDYIDIKPFDKKTNKFRKEAVYILKKKLVKACYGIEIKEQ